MTSVLHLQNHNKITKQQTNTANDIHNRLFFYASAALVSVLSQSDVISPVTFVPLREKLFRRQSDQPHRHAF